MTPVRISCKSNYGPSSLWIAVQCIFNSITRSLSPVWTRNSCTLQIVTLIFISLNPCPRGKLCTQPEGARVNNRFQLHRCVT